MFYSKPDPYGLGIPARPTLYASYSTNFSDDYISVISGTDTLKFDPLRPSRNFVRLYPVTELEQGRQYTVRLPRFNEVSFMCCNADQYMVRLIKRGPSIDAPRDSAVVETNVEIGWIED